MKKISFLITNNNKGGAQDAIIKISDLVSKEFSVEVFCVYGTGGDPRINPLFQNSTPIKLFRYFAGIYNFIKHIIIAKPDIVFSFLPLANVLNGIFSLIFRYKSIISHRNPVDTYSTTMRLADRLVASLGKYDLVTCNSYAVAVSLNSYPKKLRCKIRIVNNYAEPLNEYIDKSSLEIQLGLKLSQRFCMAVGRLSDQKKFDVLVEALRGTDVQLLIAGDGPLRNSLAERATDNIVFLGHLSGIHIKSLLHHCHVYLQPSAYEGQSNALLEALLHSCIIISSDIPSQREVLTADNCCAGILLNTYESDAWSSAIINAINTDTNPFIESVRKVRMIFSKDHIKRSLVDLLGELDEYK